MKKIESMQDAFVHELSDINHAEKQLVKALPKMAKAASDKKLAEAFETHLKETEGQIELLEKVVQLCEITLKREKCDAMEGLIKEGSEIIQEVDEGPVRDSLLIVSAQKVEHYEIASYGYLVAVAKQLGFTEAAKLLEQILAQEKQADETLNQLAMNDINDDAEQTQETTPEKGKTMARYENQERQSNYGRQQRMPARDEEGRFMSDDEGYNDRGRNQSSRSSRYQNDDYHDNRSYSSSYSNRDEDYDDDYEDNRSFSDRDEDDYDDNRSYSSSRSNRDYDDRSRSSNRGRSMSNRSDYRDDRDYRADRSRSSGQGRGWFGDSEGHAEAGRHSHDNDRGRNGNGNRSRSMNSRNDDSRSERGSSSGRGRGWFGDPAGHAAAGRHSHDNDRGYSGRR